MAVGPRFLEEAGPPEAGFLSRLREWWEREEVFGYGLILPALVLLSRWWRSRSGWPSTSASPTTGWAHRAPSSASTITARSSGTRSSARPSQNSFVFTAIALTLKTVLGVWLAVLLARNLSLQAPLRGAILLPFVIPTALSTFGLVVDVRLALQRRELDGHPLGAS